jgi:DNA replication protein DnaC
VQFGSDTEKLLLFDILNERYERRRPTILMSNLPRDEVSSYLGERVFDRLREDGGEFISFTWESYRKSRNHQGEIA